MRPSKKLTASIVLLATTTYAVYQWRSDPADIEPSVSDEATSS